MPLCKLSRFPLVGTITDATPTCVIYELAASHGCRIVQTSTSNDRISQIIPILRHTTTLEVTIDENASSIDLSLLARFVNADRHTWTLSQLFQAYDHLVSCMDDPPPLPSDMWLPGPKTPDNPLGYDACMLYRICSYYQIRTYRHTTLDQMALAVQDLISDPQDVRARILSLVQRLPLNKLIDVAMCLTNSQPSESMMEKIPIQRTAQQSWISDSKSKILPNITPQDLSQSLLDDIYTTLNDHQKTLLKVVPKNHEEAIVLAATIYGLNISESNNPYAEYLKIRDTLSLLSNGDITGIYVPIDTQFRSQYIKNPSWYRVKKTWTPILSRIYDHTQLNLFAYDEGYTPQHLRKDSPALLLHQARGSSSFYYGKHAYSDNSSTPIQWDDVDSLDSNVCVSYGIVDDKSLVVYLVRELAEHFQTSRSFSNPQRISELYSDIAIQKLRLICTNRVNNPEIPNVSRTENQNLLNAIGFVDLCNQTNTAEAIALNRIYRESSVEDQESIELTLQLLLELGMYMRGWRASSSTQKYPLQALETRFDPDDQGRVDLNVTTAITRYEDHIRGLPHHLITQVDSLPLVRTTNNQKGITFQASSNIEQGLTINDRIKIVKTGETSAASYSCIRLSSNWLTASAWYYTVAIGRSAPFEIELLAQIS